jgi:hypothetical protein
MQLLKKLGFFIVFFVTLSLIMENSVSRSEEGLFVFENPENNPLSSEGFSFEYEELGFDGIVNVFIPFVFDLITKESIHLIECKKCTSYNFIFLRPPQKFMI